MADADVAAAQQTLDELNDTDRVAAGWYGFAQPAGWAPLVLDLHTRIAAAHPNYQVRQAKEKFAGLRFYCTAGADPQVSAWIREAEQRSEAICQITGRPGATRSNPRGWVAVLCDALAEAFEAGTPLWQLADTPQSDRL